MRSVTKPELFALLEGRWALSRRIEDARAGGVHLLEGEARFVPDVATPGRLDYAETGLLQMGGQEMRAERRMIWLIDGLASARLLFGDGRPFHPLDLKDGRATARHDCGDDLYLGTYDLRDPARWQVTWQVSGPRKDYRSITIHSRT